MTSIAMKFGIISYRILGITFGGVDLKGGKLGYSLFWKVYGYIFSVINTFVIIWSFYSILTSGNISYKNQFISNCWLFGTSITSIQIFLNIWYIQRYGLELFTNIQLIGINGIKTIGKNCSQLIVWLFVINYHQIRSRAIFVSLFGFFTSYVRLLYLVINSFKWQINHFPNYFHSFQKHFWGHLCSGHICLWPGYFLFQLANSWGNGV